MSEQPSDGRTPSTPDVDQPDGGDSETSKTPDAPDTDQPQGGDQG